MSDEKTIPQREAKQARRVKGMPTVLIVSIFLAAAAIAIALLASS